jgi:predicted transcriptional regulator
MRDEELAKMTAAIVTAQVGKTVVSEDDLVVLIESIGRTLAGLGSAPAKAPVEGTAPRQRPRVSIKDSVTPELLTCLSCGKKFVLMRRHLRVDHGLEPEEYRTLWKLPSDYPITAPAYEARCRAHATARQQKLNERPNKEPRPRRSALRNEAS